MKNSLKPEQQKRSISQRLMKKSSLEIERKLKKKNSLQQPIQKIIKDAQQFNKNYNQNPFFRAKVNEMLNQQTDRKNKWYLQPHDFSDDQTKLSDEAHSIAQIRKKSLRNKEVLKCKIRTMVKDFKR